jgi:hypothetical protein
MRNGMPMAWSGQAWSFWLGGGLQVASLAGYAGAFMSKGDVALLWVGAALVVGLCGFWFMFGHPRCPACRLRWVFYIASRTHSDVAHRRVLETERCPRCGFPDRTAAPAPGQS